MIEDTLNNWGKITQNFAIIALNKRQLETGTSTNRRTKRRF